MFTVFVLLLIRRIVCSQVRSASPVGNSITVTLTSCGPMVNQGSCSYLRSACLLACRHSKLAYVQLMFYLFPAIVCHSLPLSLSLESPVQEYAADGTVELEGIASTFVPQHFANSNFSFWLQVKWFIPIIGARRRYLLEDITIFSKFNL